MNNIRTQAKVTEVAVNMLKLILLCQQSPFEQIVMDVDLMLELVNRQY